MSLLEQILEAARSGETAFAIYKRSGVSPQRVKWLCQLAEIELRKGPQTGPQRGWKKSDKRPPREHWHNPNLLIILERLRSGETCYAIARDVGLSRERIRQIGRAHGAPTDHRAARKAAREVLDQAIFEKRKSAKEERRAVGEARRAGAVIKIRELRETGLSWNEIAAAMGKQAMTVHRWAMRHCPELRERRYVPRSRPQSASVERTT